VRANAFYLDGFSPAKNDALWSPAIFKALARMADVGATFATYTSAGKVKAALTGAGFTYRKARGYGAKRDMLVGEFAPTYRVRRHAPPARAAWAQRHAIVIGAGLAGCAVAERLASRGWAITLLEQGDAPACGASGNPAGVFHPMIARAVTPATRLSSAGFLYALRHWQALADAGHTLHWQAGGLLQLAHDDSEATALREAIAAANLPAQFAVALDRDAASAYAGVALERGGIGFPRGGWIAPPSLCQAQLSAARATRSTDGHAPLWRALFGTHVARLVHEGGCWHAFDAAGARIAAAPVAVIANAHDAVRLGQLAHAPVRPARGQLTILPHTAPASLRVPVIGDGYALPLDASRLMTGASYDMDDTGLEERSTSHDENLARLRRLIPSLAQSFEPATVQGRVGIRCVVGDRLPMAGPLADESDPIAARASRAGVQLPDLQRRPGLYGAFAYGSRGLVWAALCAELLASQIDGEPWPLERDLADALDPARYLLRALRATAQR
jgi:tRNA 5-methylaminomethyl-2-thiouridine biosynthesis bifunctional protein